MKTFFFSFIIFSSILVVGLLVHAQVAEIDSEIEIDPILTTDFSRSEAVTAMVASTSLTVADAIPLAISHKDAVSTNQLLFEILVQLKVINNRLRK